MRKFIVLLVSITVFFTVFCSDKTTDPKNDETVTITDYYGSVQVIVKKGDISGDPDDIYIASAFLEEGIILNIEAPFSLNGTAQVEIDLAGELAAGTSDTQSVYLYLIDSQGEVTYSEEVKYDNSENKIALAIESFGMVFISYAANPSGIFQCPNLEELVKYIALKGLETAIAFISANETSWDQDRRCREYFRFYTLCQIGTRLFPEYQFGGELLKTWLSGKGEPVKIANERFDDKDKTSLTWRDVWEEAAWVRIDKEDKCGLLASGASGQLPSEITTSRESSTIGVGSYDLHTSGSYQAECDEEGNAHFVFEISVQARDLVDFNLNSAFLFDEVVCGEPFVIIIPDRWGRYLQNTCAMVKDYDILGEETSFSFAASKVGSVPCDECAPQPSCEDFPPPLGEVWTYRVIGNAYVFSLTTEPVSTQIGGYDVYRWRRTDSPPGLGEYIGCDPAFGLVWVASDSWNVFDPSDYTRHVFDEPIPIDLCPYGTPVGTTCHMRGASIEVEVVIEVLAYEDITVPYGTFQNAQKILSTTYDDGIVDEDLPPIYEWKDEAIGTIKELEVNPESEIGIELIGYQPAPGGKHSAAIYTNVKGNPVIRKLCSPPRVKRRVGL